jgi:hypothetical protein
LVSEEAERGGDCLVDIATRVRRYKSDHALSLGAPLLELAVVPPNESDASLLAAGVPDVASVTRAEKVTLVAAVGPEMEAIPASDPRSVELGVRR